MSHKENDYYHLLDVSRDASTEEIKRSFKRLAMKHHPDRNAQSREAEEKFKNIKKAYEVLSDPKKRAHYDRFGHEEMHASSGGFDDIGDIFEAMFGGNWSGGHKRGSGKRQRSRGSDLKYILKVSLSSVLRDCVHTIHIPIWSRCSACEGTGSRSRSGPKPCATCHGHGQVRMSSGFITVQQTCPHCNGGGQAIPDPCGPCHGGGYQKSNQPKEVRIPAGLDSGDSVCLEGFGEPDAQGGSPGDLYVAIEIEKHPIFSRDGSHLHCDLPIDCVTASLGGTVSVATLTGTENIHIAPGTQTNHVLRLKHHGLVSKERPSERGDLCCRISIETPIQLEENQKEILRQFNNSCSAQKNTHYPKQHRWNEAVRAFFSGDEAKHR